jgi:hypothetical protein
LMLSRAQRMRRALATIVASAGLLAGTFWGNDYHFPFGPFRMYSVANRLDGRIRSAVVEVRTDESGWLRARTPADIGMKRAEIEGQVDRFVADPDLLKHLATAYERLNPDGTEVFAVRLLQETTQLRNGRPSGLVEVTTLATWGRT